MAELISSDCGAVVRDDRGDFVGAATTGLEQVADVISMEVSALREGILLAPKLGCNNLIIQSYNLVLVELMNTNSGWSMR